MNRDIDDIAEDYYDLLWQLYYEPQNKPEPNEDDYADQEEFNID